MWLTLVILLVFGAVLAPDPELVLAQSPNTWAAADSMSLARQGHTATVLHDGRLLVVGGLDASGTATTSVELWDPLTETFAVGPDLPGPGRSGHFAVRLLDGRVLVGGGVGGALNAAYLFVPASNTWTFAGTLTVARDAPTALLLRDGRVLVTGGVNFGSPLDSIEIFDGTGFVASPAATMQQARTGHSMTLLPADRVLLVGGTTAGGLTASTEIWDPAGGGAGTFVAGPSLATARTDHTATMLPDGRVLIAGGTGDGGALASSEIYSDQSGGFNGGPPLDAARARAGAVLLATGDVLVAGGCAPCPDSALQSAELLDAATTLFFPVDGMSVPRTAAPLVRLRDGGALIVGGRRGGAALAGAERFTHEVVRAYVANSGDGTVTVLDAATSVTSTAQVAVIPVGATPRGVAVNRQGTRVYVANEGSDSVSVIDATTNTVVATVSPITAPIGVAVSPDGTRVYVTTGNPSAGLAVVDTSTNVVTSQVDLGGAGLAVATSSLTNKIYVSATGGTLHELDAAPLTGGSIAFGSDLFGVAVSPGDQRVFATDFGGNQFVAFSTPLPGGVGTRAVGANPAGIAVGLDGRWTYVANSGEFSVTAVDTTAAAFGTTTLSSDIGPTGVAVRPDGLRVYTTHAPTFRVNVFDDAFSVTQTAALTSPVPVTRTAAIDVGNAPDGVAVGVVAAAASTSASLVVGITASPNPVLSGSNVTYTITVFNPGPDAADNVTLTIVTPAGTTYQSLTPPGGVSCSTPATGGTGTIACSSASLASGTNLLVTLVLRATAASGSITTTVDAGSSTPGANGTASATVTVTPTGAISGKVTQTDGTTPVAGATVRVLSPDSAAQRGSAVSAADGTYTVSGLAARNYVLSAVASGFAAEYYNNQTNFNSATSVTVTAGATTPDINFTLAGNAGGIKGRVTLDDGVTAVSSVTITVRTPDNSYILSTSTDGSGNYDTGRVLAAGSYLVRATKAGFATTYYVNASTGIAATPVTVPAGNDVSGVDIELSTSVGGISGRVTRDVTGTPLAQAGVSIYDAATNAFVVGGFETNSSGNYSTGLTLRPGTYKVTVSFTGSTSITYNGRLSTATGDPVTVAAGVTTPNIDIELPLQGAISGRVTDAATAGNLSGAVVEVFDYATGAFVRSAASAADGTYTAGGLNPGVAYRIRARRTGYGTVYANGKPSAGTADLLTVAGGGSITLDFALQPGAGGISGRAFDAAVPATGIGSAVIDIYDGATSNLSISNLVTSVTADGSGNFNTGLVLAPGLYKVAARRFNSGYVTTLWPSGRDLSTAQAVTVTAATTTGSIDIGLPLGGTITGTVRGRESGLAISGATVVAQRLNASGFFGSYNVTTNSSGVYNITGLDLGEWLLTAQTAGRVVGWHSGDPSNPGTDFSTARPVAVTSTAAVAGVDFALALGGGSIQGRITRDDGQPPPAGTTIRVHGLWPRTSTANISGSTNGLGDYSVTGLPPGRYVVEARGFQLPNGTGGGFHPFPAAARAAGVPVEITDGGVATVDFQVLGFSGGEFPRAIRGTLRTPGGAPVREAFVAVSEPYGVNTVRVFPAYHDGSFVLDGLRPGRYLVGATTEKTFRGTAWPAEPTSAAATVVDVTAGDVTGLQIVLPDDAGTVSGTVTRSDTGQPVAGAVVSIRNFANNPVGSATTRMDGTYLARGVAPGAYHVRVTAPGFLTQYFVAGVPAGARTLDAGSFVAVGAGADASGIDVVLDPGGGSVAGTVRLQGSLEPVATGLIDIRDAATGSSVAFATTDVTGAFSTDGLAPGTYKLLARDSLDSRYAAQWYSGAATRDAAAAVTVTAGVVTGDRDFVVSETRGSISGTAYAADGVTPLPGVGVSVFDRVSQGFVRGAGVTNHDGQYTATGLAPGVDAYVVRGHALGRALEFFDRAPAFTTAASVTVTAGVTTPGVNFAMPLSSAVQGGVSYAGTATGTLRVRLYTDAALAQQAYEIALAAPTAGGPGAFAWDYAFSLQPSPDTLGVRAGNYYVAAFLDVNGNGGQDGNEPFGKFGPVVTVPEDATITVGGFELVDPGAAHADLVVGASASPSPVLSSSNLTYSIAVSNLGPDAATAVTLTAAIPAGTTFQSASATQGACTTPAVGAGGSLDCTLGVIDNGAGATVTLTVRVTAPSGFVNFTASVDSPTPDAAGGNNTALVSTAITPLGTISGRVTQTDGLTAIPGATVRIYNADSGYSVTATATLADGTYAVPGLTPRTYKVSAAAPGFATEYYNNQTTLNAGTVVTVPGGGTAANVDLTLAGGAGGIAGRVTLEDGTTPVAGAEVSVRGPGGELILFSTTDGSGNFNTGRVLAAGAYMLRIFAAGYPIVYYDGARSATSARLITVAANADTTGIEVRLPSAVPGGISGRVTRAGTGAPLAAIGVSVYEASTNGFIRGFTTDANGDYTTGLALAPGAYKVSTSLGGSASITWNGKISTATGDPITVTAGAVTAGIDFEVPLLGALAGVVTDAGTTAPIVGAVVEVNDSATGAFITSATTGTGGAYTIANLIPDAAYRVRARATGYGALFANNKLTAGLADVVTVPAGATAALDFALSPGRAISGRITDASTGLPVASGFVNVYDGSSTNFTINNFITGTGTDASGNYTTQSLPPGFYKVAAGKSGAGYIQTLHAGGRDLSTATPVSVTATADTTNLDIALPLGGIITGTVRDRVTGLALAGANVIAQRVSSSSFFGQFNVTANAGGVFTLAGLHAGEWLVMAQAAGHTLGWYTGNPNDLATDFSTATPITVTGTATISGADFNLQPGGGKIQGRALRQDTGQPVRAGTSVTIRGPWPRTSTVSAGAIPVNGLGDFAYTGLPPGQYMVEVNPDPVPDGTANAFHPSRAISRGSAVPVTVVDGGVATTALEAVGFSGGAAPRAIRGTLRTPGGASIREAFVFAIEPHGQSVVRVVTAFDDGSFTVAGLPPGQYLLNSTTEKTFVATPYGGQVVGGSLVIDLTAGDANGIDLTLADTAATITGRVTRADNGQPVDGAVVSIRNFFNNSVAGATTGRTDGTYLVRGIPAGSYKIRVSVPGFVTQYYVVGNPAGSPSADGASYLTVAAGTNTPNIDLVLQPTTGALAGTVRRQGTLEPVVATIVGVYDGSGSAVTFLNTDANGLFRTEGLAPGTYKILALDTLVARYAMQWFNGQTTLEQAEVVTVVAGGVTTGVDFLVAPDHGAIAGTVYQLDGVTPLPGAGVIVYDRVTGGAVRSGGVTNNQGQYTVAGLPPGVNAYVARGHALGRALEYHDGQAARSAATAITVTAGTVAGGIDFALPLTSVVSGTVSYGGPQTGTLRVQLASDDSYVHIAYDRAYPGTTIFPAPYEFSADAAPDRRGVLAGSYFIRIFIDANGNGVPDPDEAASTGATLIVVPENSVVFSSITMLDPVGTTNSPPVADAQAVLVVAGAPKSIVLTGQDVETATANFTYTVVTPPLNGVLGTTLNPQERVYTPNPGFTGNDSFTFKVTDGGDPDGCAPGPGCAAPLTSPAATVTITVGPNAGTTSDGLFTTTLTAPPAGGVAGPAQALGDIRINENATGALLAGSAVKISLPAGLTFAAPPVVSTIVGNGTAIGAVLLESGGNVASFTLLAPSTTGPASLRVSSMLVVIPPGYLGAGVAASNLSVSLFGPNPGLTSASIQTAVVVAAGGPPVVTSDGISLHSIGQGAQDTTVVIVGSNFEAGTTVSFGPGITVESVTVDSPTQITVRLDAAVNASLGVRDIVITNPSTGQSVTLGGAFQVTAPPTITGTDRTAAKPLATNLQGQQVVITGTNFLPPTMSPPDIGVLFSGGDVIVTEVSYVGPNELGAVVSVTAGAPFGPRDLTVVNPNGGFATLAAAVMVGEVAIGAAPPSKNASTPPPPPSLTSLSPTSGLIGSEVVLSGSGLSPSPSVTFAGAAGPRLAATVLEATSASVRVTVPAGATTGNVTVAVNGLLSNGLPFAVTNPTLSAVTPSSGYVGTTQAITLSGSRFVAGLALSLGPGVGVVGPTAVSPEGTTIQTVIAIAADATTGPRDVTVTNPDTGKATLAAGFEVRPPVVAALELSLLDAASGAAIPTASYLPAVQSVAVTLDASGRCTQKTITPAVVGLRALFVTTTGAVPPGAVVFTLESSALPGTATNEDCELDPANPAKDFYLVDPVTGLETQEVTVPGAAGVYSLPLYSRDMGGTVLVRVRADDGSNTTGTLRLPVDTDGDGLPDAYESNAALNADQTGANVLAPSNPDRNGNGVRDGDDRFARDGLSNFEKYRGVYLVGPRPGMAGTLIGFERLGAGVRHFFVRSQGFGDDPALPQGYCGIDADTGAPVADPRPCPRFQVGLAFDRIGVRVHNVTGSFTGTTQLPRQSLADSTKPTLDMATIVYEGAKCSGGEDCTKIGKYGSRQWQFRTLGYSNFGTPSAYGVLIRVYKRAVDSYFHAKPYEHRTNDPYAVVTAPDGTPMLAPLSRVGDSSNTGGDNGLVDSKEKTVNGQLAGDTYIPGRFDLQLTALDVNNDGCIELPTVADPTTLPRCDPLADSAATPQATKQQVVRSLITHELGHATGINLHTSDATDLMYQYTINWTRDGNFSKTAADLVQIHNKGLQ